MYFEDKNKENFKIYLQKMKAIALFFQTCGLCFLGTLIF